MASLNLDNMTALGGCINRKHPGNNARSDPLYFARASLPGEEILLCANRLSSMYMDMPDLKLTDV